MHVHSNIGLLVDMVWEKWRGRPGVVPCNAWQWESANSRPTWIYAYKDNNPVYIVPIHFVIGQFKYTFSGTTKQRTKIHFSELNQQLCTYSHTLTIYLNICNSIGYAMEHVHSLHVVLGPAAVFHFNRGSWWRVGLVDCHCRWDTSWRKKDECDGGNSVNVRMGSR